MKDSIFTWFVLKDSWEGSRFSLQTSLKFGAFWLTFEFSVVGILGFCNFMVFECKIQFFFFFTGF